MDLASLVSDLIRIDSSAPSGDAVGIVQLVAQVLGSAGIPVNEISSDPDRPILLATVTGSGSAPPLLVHGHLDVVGADENDWAHDPFGGDIIDGWIWGRGALDMKGPIAMMIDAVIRCSSGPAPAGDIILCLVTDEETGGERGAGYLVDQHPELLRGVRYAIGEFGGFTFGFAGGRFSPIQVSERTGVPMEITFRGSGGHGSLPTHDGALAKLGRALVKLDRGYLPPRITPAARAMLEAIAPHVAKSYRFMIEKLLDPRTSRAVFWATHRRLGSIASILAPTATPTVVDAGSEINVVPSTATLAIDARMLPGMTVPEWIADIRSLIDVECDVHVLEDGTSLPLHPDMSLFDLLASAARAMDPLAVPIPYLSPAVTDARWFSRLGIQCYGFTPMSLPTDFDFAATVHGANERIPVNALEPGADALLAVLSGYGRTEDDA